MRKRKVLIINTILFHYRRGVFLALDCNNEISFTFAAAPGRYNGIECMDPNELNDYVSIENKRFGPFKWQSGILKLIKSKEYDAVIFLGDSKIVSNWLMASFARIIGIPVYFWTIGWHRPESGIKKWTRLAFYRLANQLLVYGEVGRGVGVALGYPANRINVIGNSVQSITQDNNRNSILLPEKKSTELWLGAVIRPTPVKKLELLITAAGILQSQGKSVRILIVGVGPCLETLVELARENGVVAYFPGAAYSAQEMQRIYKILDITVVPAAVGLTAIQSLSYGVPVISDNSPYTQMPEWEAILPGITGDLYKPNDVNDLVRAIINVSNLLDLKKKSVKSSCISEYTERWTAEKHAGRIIEALKSDIANT